MAGRTVIHVVPCAGRWRIQREDRAVVEYVRKDVAVKAARQLARHNPPSLLIVHGNDGRIDDRAAYTDEPFRLVADKQLRFGSRVPRGRPVLRLWPNTFEDSVPAKRRDLQRDRSLAAWHRNLAGRRAAKRR